MLRSCYVAIVLFNTLFSFAQPYYLLIPDRLFDGDTMRIGWQVSVHGPLITGIGPSLTMPKETQIIRLPGTTLMPGLIEGHSHILLHPYNETSWNDQVLFESEAERTARAINHLKWSLDAGITSMRDLGTEGAGYIDIGLRQSLKKKIIEGPDLQCAGRAIVATGSYGPKSDVFAPPLGAESADGNDLIRVVRDQIGHGVDVIKLYADYRWGINGAAMPTFSIEEIKTIVETAHSAGRPVVAHASTKDGMLRAILGGVNTIEHGDEGDQEIFDLMKARHVALCPTLEAGEAIMSYNGWKKNQDSLPERVKSKMKSFGIAMKSGVEIIFGGDVGVFPHGQNVKELFLMHEYGMKTIQALKCATSGNAELLQFKNKGRLKSGFLADIIACKGDPISDLHVLSDIPFVMKSGKVIKQ